MMQARLSDAVNYASSLEQISRPDEWVSRFIRRQSLSLLRFVQHEG
jgi:hypothetical protein